MKILVLTNKDSLFGKKLLNELIVQHVRLQATLVVHQPLSYYLKLFGYVRKRVGIIDALYFSVIRMFFSERDPGLWKGRQFIDRYEDLNVPVIHTHGSNSDETRRTLQDLKPDLVLLGQAGIIGKRMLEIPVLGMLNAHTGVLPQYRGMDCPKWALLADDPEHIGCSVHWVDKGVDTGPIVLKEAYSIRDGETMETLESNLEDLAVAMLARVAAGIVENRQHISTPQVLADGRQYYKMSRAGESQVRRKLSRR